jgi:hypothetical protein
MRATATRLGRFLRGWRFDRNPLRRATDRIETAVLAVLVIAFLAGAPAAALATGAWIHGLAQRAQLSQEASRFQVPAVVLTMTTPSASGNPLADQAQARWKAPDGREVTGEVPVPGNTVVGQTIKVWTDRAGNITAPPLLDGQVAGQTVLGEALGVTGAVCAVTLAGVLARWALNRRRMADWDADWQATGPRWTTRA